VIDLERAGGAGEHYRLRVVTADLGGGAFADDNRGGDGVRPRTRGRIDSELRDRRAACRRCSSGCAVSGFGTGDV